MVLMKGGKGGKGKGGRGSARGRKQTNKPWVPWSLLVGCWLMVERMVEEVEGLYNYKCMITNWFILAVSSVKHG